MGSYRCHGVTKSTGVGDREHRLEREGNHRQLSSAVADQLRENDRQASHFDGLGVLSANAPRGIGARGRSGISGRRRNSLPRKLLLLIVWNFVSVPKFHFCYRLLATCFKKESFHEIF